MGLQDRNVRTLSGKNIATEPTQIVAEYYNSAFYLCHCPYSSCYYVIYWDCINVVLNQKREKLLNG